jgi:hypothetical protein
MAVLQGRMALVVQVVQEPGEAPQLDVAVKAGRVGAHGRLHGQHVAAQGV